MAECQKKGGERGEINARGICEEFTLEIRKEIERIMRSKLQDFTDYVDDVIVLINIY